MSDVFYAPRCKDCKFDHDCDHAITVRNEQGVVSCPVDFCSAGRAKDGTVDRFAPVRYGTWLRMPHKGTGFYIYQCSSCKQETIGRQKYCPNCGARMDGVKQ